MKFFISILLLAMLLSWSCNQNGTGPDLTDTEILLEGMDQVTSGGNLQVVINTQAEYETLIYNRYTKPLQEYWNAHYLSILQSVKNNHPNLSDSEYTVLVKNVFYSVYPFRGLEGYSHPSIDFSRYTLLGQNVDGGGCRKPDYLVSIIRIDSLRMVTFKVMVQQHGICKAPFVKNQWMLVRKIPETYKVAFAVEYSRDEH